MDIIVMVCSKLEDKHDDDEEKVVFLIQHSVH